MIGHVEMFFNSTNSNYRLLKKISEARRAKIDKRRRTLLVR
jgi:hypothetical protein